MKFVFGAFVVDTELGELTRAGEVVSVEPRTFSFLCHLIENRDRMVTKDDLVENLWNGRIVSDAAISTVVKNARRVLDDDGKAQKFIRTVHGRGFRFVGELTDDPNDGLEWREPSMIKVGNEPQDRSGLDLTSDIDVGLDMKGERPTIAVLPFSATGVTDSLSAIADAIPGELISSLSRLRWLRVIARGSSFRFRNFTHDFDTIRQKLGATYCLVGDVEIIGQVLAITLELTDARTSRTIWGERLTGKIGDVHQMRSDIVGLVISALELHIPLNEVELARLKPPESLDAWSNYHFGLQHMYRFNKDDNILAAQYLKRATDLDPDFARAFAARSFTSFQSAFLRYGTDRTVDIDNARRFAERSVEIDPMDPAGNFNYGRSHWLQEDPEAGQAWIERAISLSPSFAQAQYAHGWADVMAGKGASALDHVQKAILLSPLDPFLYAMQSARGLAHLVERELDPAAYWADQGARRPGAHYLIFAIAAAIHNLAGNREKADYWAKKSLHLRPATSVKQFFNAFPFEDPTTRELLGRSLSELGYVDDR